MIDTIQSKNQINSKTERELRWVWLSQKSEQMSATVNWELFQNSSKQEQFQTGNTLEPVSKPVQPQAPSRDKDLNRILKFQMIQILRYKRWHLQTDSNQNILKQKSFDEIK